MGDENKKEKKSTGDKDNEAFNFAKLFEKTLADTVEERKSGKRSASTEEVLKWFDELPKQDRGCLEQGITAITYRGAMDAAKRQYDSLVRKVKASGVHGNSNSNNNKKRKDGK